jgi:hypothetical protein
VLSGKFHVTRSVCVCFFLIDVLLELPKNTPIITPNTIPILFRGVHDVCTCTRGMWGAALSKFYVVSASYLLTRSLCVRCFHAVDVQKCYIWPPNTTPFLFWSPHDAFACVRGM